MKFTIEFDEDRVRDVDTIKEYIEKIMAIHFAMEMAVGDIKYYIEK